MNGLVSYRRFGRARSLHSNRAGWTATNRARLRLGCYVATELCACLVAAYRSSLACLRSDCHTRACPPPIWIHVRCLRTIARPIPGCRGKSQASMSRRARRSLQNLGHKPGRSVQILVVVANIQMRTLKAEVGKGSMSTALAHGLVDLKNVAVDGNVRKSGDIGGNSLSTLEMAQPEHVTWCPVHSRRPLKIRRTECRSCPVSKVNSLWSMEQYRQGKSAKWIRLGSGVPVPNMSTVGGLLELLTWREGTASGRPGDGLGTALLGSFPGCRTANSELVRTRGIRLFN
ncbi:hypothetical protein YC2023_066194 [Brassica napus]